MKTNSMKIGTVRSSDQSTRRQVLAGTSMLAAATAVGRSPAVSAQHNLQATPVPEPQGDALKVVYGFEAQFTDMLLIGLTTRGVRYDFPYEGEVVTGPLLGASVRGTDYLLLRPDGVGVIDARGLVTTTQGDIVAYQSTGYVHMPTGVELPLEMLLDPGFTWPDMDLMLHGFSLNETGAPDLVWLNRYAFAFRGIANAGTGALSATFYAFTPIVELPAG